MATLRVSGLSPRLRAIAGRDVATNVESRVSMNRAQATINGRTIGGLSVWGSIVVVGSDISESHNSAPLQKWCCSLNKSALRCAQDGTCSRVLRRGDMRGSKLRFVNPA